MSSEYDPDAYAQSLDPAIADPYLRCEKMAAEIAALHARVAGLEAQIARLTEERDEARDALIRHGESVLAIEALRARCARLEAALRGCTDDVEAWCKAIDENGTGWDDWDEHYKGFWYRGGLAAYRAALAQESGK